MEDVGFTIKNQSHSGLPEEDKFRFKRIKNRMVAAIADGITRDPKRLRNFPSHETLGFDAVFVYNYPEPSPASIVAEIFVRKVAGKIKELNIGSILGAVAFANNEIGEWNRKHIPKPDYLFHDLAGCVGIVYTVDNSRNINFAYIADCGLAVFDFNGRLKFITKDLMEEGRRFRDYSNGKEIDWRKATDRIRVRKNFRNKFRKGGYGAFTGERVALDKRLLFIGKLKAEKGDYVIGFTDGARKYFEEAKEDAGRVLIESGINGLKGYLQTGKYDERERTIVAAKID